MAPFEWISIGANSNKMGNVDVLAGATLIEKVSQGHGWRCSLRPGWDSCGDEIQRSLPPHCSSTNEVAVHLCGSTSNLPVPFLRRPRLALGFHAAGFRCLSLSEFNKHAFVSTIEANLHPFGLTYPHLYPQ